jgi:SAM-dependent methyltransferase
MTDVQRRLEQDLRSLLIQEGSVDAFRAAYDQFHHHVLSHGMWGKPTFGRLYRSKIDPIDSLFLRLIPPGSSVLEVGIGDGVFATACSSKGNSMVGLDISKIALQVTSRFHANGAAPHLLQGDARSLCFADTSFRFVISRDLIEHLPEKDVLAHLREVKRVLRPDGKYLLWTPPPWLSHSLGLHLKEYTTKEVLHLLDQEGFHAKVIPLHLGMLGLPNALKPDSWPLMAFLHIEMLTCSLSASKLIEKLPIPLRFALLPSACIVAFKKRP